MAKAKIPNSILSKFSEPQFKINDIVYMSWMGDKYFGSIESIGSRSGFTVYTVKTYNYRYPCGLQIGIHKSGSAGVILYDITKTLTHEELCRGFESRPKPKTTIVTTEASSDNTSNIRSNQEILPDKPARKSSRKNGVQPSNERTTSNVKPSRNATKSDTKFKSYSKLDEAIQKQKEFLRKFN